jgi:hypothetical protein
MDSRQAREILVLYRPNTMDAADPMISEALEAAQRDPELAAWLEEHGAVYSAIRGKLKEIPIPADLKRRIILDHASRSRVIKFPAAVKYALAAAAVIALTITGWLWFAPANNSGFAQYRVRMASKAARGYNMDFFVPDQAAIRAEFVARKLPVDYTFSKTLGSLPATGGAVAKFEEHPVEMLCLYDGVNSGGGRNDLWVFVAARSSVPGAPLPGKKEFLTTSGMMTVSWTQGDKVYLIVGAGDEKTLGKYLE